MGNGIGSIERQHIGGRHQWPHPRHRAQGANFRVSLDQGFDLLIQLVDLLVQSLDQGAVSLRIFCVVLTYIHARTLALKKQCYKYSLLCRAPDPNPPCSSARSPRLPFCYASSLAGLLLHLIECVADSVIACSARPAVSFHLKPRWLAAVLDRLKGRPYKTNS